MRQIWQRRDSDSNEERPSNTEESNSGLTTHYAQEESKTMTSASNLPDWILIHHHAFPEGACRWIAPCVVFVIYARRTFVVTISSQSNDVNMVAVPVLRSCIRYDCICPGMHNRSKS